MGLAPTNCIRSFPSCAKPGDSIKGTECFCATEVAKRSTLTEDNHMQKLAKVGRINRDGSVRVAAVNTALVRYVVAQDQGTYIAFDDEHSATDMAVTPIGVSSPDSVDDIIKRLNRPYWNDLILRSLAIVGSVVAVVLAILLAQEI